MSGARAALALVAVVTVGLMLVSGGSGADPRTPEGLPGLPPPFLGTAVVGGGRLTAAIDAYGDVVDLRATPAGRPLIDNPSDRQAAGTVPTDTGIVPWVSRGDRPARPVWEADSVRQRYRPGTNVLVTTARFGAAHVRIVYAASDSRLACLTAAGGDVHVSPRSAEPAARRRVRCDGPPAHQAVRAAEQGDRRWLRRARPLAPGAPTWARQMYERSLLVLHALTDPRTGAVAAGARDDWAYVWPRDAATVGLALNAAGYRGESRRITRFLLALDLGAAARFDGRGVPVPGRGPQGDATGWVAVAARAVGLDPPPPSPWRNLPDYQEGVPGNYLGNILAAGEPVIRHLYGDGSEVRLRRQPRDPDSGLDSAAAWAVEPFAKSLLYTPARRTMRRLARRGDRFGITPGEAWSGRDPWTAPTAWTAWSFAALGERREALQLVRDLRRAATPSGALPERVDAHTGVPRSTTPLAWSHAFAILALQELWPNRTASNFPSGR
jgi:hypothetical protein